MFVRTGKLLWLEVYGKLIGTTGEHPFWVRGKGWTHAMELQVGDELSSHDGRWVAVEGVEDRGEYATLYNMRGLNTTHTVEVALGITRRQAWVAGELNSNDQ